MRAVARRCDRLMAGNRSRRKRSWQQRYTRCPPYAPAHAGRALMQLFIQQIVEGLASGAIYASLALALVLIYRATRIVNFAQGEMATLSVYLAWQLNQWACRSGSA